MFNILCLFGTLLFALNPHCHRGQKVTKPSSSSFLKNMMVDAPIINNISNILFLLYSFICFEPSLPQGLVGHQASSSYFPKNVYSNAMNQIWYVKERYVWCYYKFLTYTLIGPPPLFHKRQKVTRTSSSYLPNKDIAMDKFRFHFVTEIDENKKQRHWTWPYILN